MIYAGLSGTSAASNVEVLTDSLQHVYKHFCADSTASQLPPLDNQGTAVRLPG